MANYEFIMEMIKKNNGTITAAEVTKAGISRGNLKYMVDTGLLERTGRGNIVRAYQMLLNARSEEKIKTLHCCVNTDRN